MARPGEFCPTPGNFAIRRNDLRPRPDPPDLGRTLIKLAPCVGQRLSARGPLQQLHAQVRSRSLTRRLTIDLAIPSALRGSAKAAKIHHSNE